MLRYVASGRVDMGRLALGAPLGVAACAAIGAGYQVFQQAVPLLWLAVLATLAAGLLLGLLAGALARFVQSRGWPGLRWIGLCWGVAAIAASFVAGYATGAGASDAAPAEASLQGFFDYWKGRIDAGWVLGGHTGAGVGRSLDGPLVVLAWLGESGILVYATFAAVKCTAADPFCEPCRRFARAGSPTLVPVDASALRAAGARSDLSVVLSVPQAHGARRLASYTIYTCPSCGERTWLDVRLEYAELPAASAEPHYCFSEALAGCTASIAALAVEPGKCTPDRPIRGAPLTVGESAALRRRLSEVTAKTRE
jgi:hypothetical protein